MLEGIEHHPTNDGAFANASLKANIKIYVWAAIIFVA
jgi:hypothetical protein